MKNIKEMTNEQRIALIKLAVIGSIGQASVSIDFNEEQDYLLSTIIDEQSKIVHGVKFTDGSAEGVLNMLKDLFAFIDKLHKA